MEASILDISSPMDTLEKAELTVSIRHIAIFSKSGMPIYNSEVPDTAGRKTRRMDAASLFRLPKNTLSTWKKTKKISSNRMKEVLGLK